MHIEFVFSDTAKQKLLTEADENGASGRLLSAGVTVSFRDPREADALPLSRENEIVISDQPEVLEAYSKRGICCIGFMKEEGFFPGAETVICSLDALTGPFLDRTLAHHLGRPFVITSRADYTLRESVPADFSHLLPVFETCQEEQQHGFYIMRGKSEEEKQACFAAYTGTVYRLFGYGMWTVTAEQIPVGWFGICPPDQEDETGEEPQLAYILKESLRGRGLAGRICTDIIAYAKEELAFEKLSAWVHEDNLPSRALLRSLRFREAGRGREMPHVLHYILNLEGAGYSISEAAQ